MKQRASKPIFFKILLAVTEAASAQFKRAIPDSGGVAFPSPYMPSTGGAESGIGTVEMSDDQTRKLSETLKGISDDELAEYRENHADNTKEGILADRDFERRARIAQHELDVGLVAKQVRWMKFAAILGAVATVVGTIIGALLTFRLQRNPQLKQSGSPSRPTQAQNGVSTSVDRTEKAVTSPLKPPNRP